MIHLDLFLEILVRLILWMLHAYFEETKPFMRKIQPDELWKYQYPVTVSYVTSNKLWQIIIACPLTFCVLEYLICKKTEDLITFFKAISLGYTLNGCVTSFFKVIVGKPRPDFYYRCFPNGKGTDFTQCTGRNNKALMDGRKSWPSGHSSFAFACATFMSLYIARKLKLFDDNQEKQAWKLCACVLPFVISAAIAISRTCDYHHHYEDVISGSLLGTIISYLCYNLYFSPATIIPSEKNVIPPET